MAKKRDGLFLRGNTWWVDYVHPVTGKRNRHSAKTSIKAKAREMLEREKGQAWDQKYGNAEIQWTLSELLDWAWREFWSQKPGADKYRSDFAIKAVLHSLGNCLASEITPEQIRAFRRHRENVDGVKKSTTNRELTRVAFAYARAIDEGKLHANPFRKMRVSERQFKRDRSATDLERAALICESMGMLHKIIRFAFATGMRDGEIRALRPQDVDFDNQVVKTESWKGGDVIRRNIEFRLDPDIRPILESMCMKHPYVFHGPDGEKIPKNGLVHAGFPRLCKRLGIDDFHFHDIRHSFATKQWVDRHNIVELHHALGHQKLDTTMTYINVKSHQLVVNPWHVLDTMGKQDNEKSSKNID